MLCRGGAEALALHLDDSALGFYPGSDVLGSLQVGDVGRRIGDADVRSLWPTASMTKDCGNGRLMSESDDRFSRRDRRLRQGAAWIGAAGIYGAAQGLSAWAAQRAQGRGTRPQYEQFERPAFAPPGAVFPVVWSALNLTTATSAWRVWRAREPRPQAPSRREVLAWWVLAVIIRSGYTPLAFGGRRLWAATADAALLFAVMVRYAFLARRVDQTAAVLAVPEVAWTAFATVLSTAVAAKNG